MPRPWRVLPVIAGSEGQRHVVLTRPVAAHAADGQVVMDVDAGLVFAFIEGFYNPRRCRPAVRAGSRRSAGRGGTCTGCMAAAVAPSGAGAR